MLDGWLARHLSCPRDRQAFEEIDEELVCSSGHRFPIISGIPVLLIEEADPTLHVIGGSIEAAREKNRTDDCLFLQTLGIHEEERQSVLRDFQAGKNSVDPVINYLVAHTNGILYKHLVGRLQEYPIPQIDLPNGSGEYFLDIGCSWGRWCMAGARKGYVPIGIDPSLGAVLAGRRAARSLSLDVKWVVGDARYLPFKDNIFDVVYSYSVLQHFGIEDVKKTLKEATRVLDGNGFVQLQFANCYGLRSIYHQARRGFREARGFEVRYLDPRAIENFFSPSEYAVDLRSDCYFGLGLQKADSHLMPFWKKVLLWTSELLKRLSFGFRPLRLVADSVFLIASHR